MITPTIIPIVVTFLCFVFFILGNNSVIEMNNNIPSVTDKSIPEIIGEIALSPRKNIISPPTNVDNDTNKILSIDLYTFSLLW